MRQKHKENRPHKRARHRRRNNYATNAHSEDKSSLRLVDPGGRFNDDNSLLAMAMALMSVRTRGRGR